MVASTSVDPGPELLAVAAEPVRWRLLQVLAGGQRCVCELQRQVPVAANLLSYHLKVLRGAGLITGSRRGRWVDYRLADDALDRLHAALPGTGADAGAACPTPSAAGRCR